MSSANGDRNIPPRESKLSSVIGDKKNSISIFPVELYPVEAQSSTTINRDIMKIFEFENLNSAHAGTLVEKGHVH